jgi:hypothetical protein
MYRIEFLFRPAVIGFVDWAATYLLTIPVNLYISASGTGRADGQRGPGVVGYFQGIDAVINAYHWRAQWSAADRTVVFSDDWTSTKQSLSQLSHWIQREVNQGLQGGSENACYAIIRWGGDRNPNVGATRFVEGLHDVPGYLSGVRQQLRLSHANTQELDTVLEANSMLSKIYALNASDGLPIYDSRVAAAISSLVEIYRQRTQQPGSEIPEELLFKAAEDIQRRRVLGLDAARLDFADPMFDPGVITRGTSVTQKQKRAQEWASSKIRLGWLLNAILEKAEENGAPLLGPGTPLDANMPAKMHALEAGLFMLGFDVSCL